MIIDPTFQIILGAEMALLDGDVPVPAPFHRTVALHKPAGVVCARAKTRHRNSPGRGAQPDQVSVFTVLAATGLSHQTMGSVNPSSVLPPPPLLSPPLVETVRLPRRL